MVPEPEQVLELELAWVLVRVPEQELARVLEQEQEPVEHSRPGPRQ